MSASSGKDYLYQDKTKKFLDRNLWKRLGLLMAPHKWIIAFSFFCLFLSQLLPQIQPRLLKRLADGPIASGDFDGVLPYCLMFLGIVLLSGILNYCASISSQAASLRIIHNLRVALFKNIQELKMDFFKRTPVGRLMTRLTNDIDSITTMFSEGFVDLAGAGLMLFFPVIFMFTLNWRLSLFTLAITPLLLIATSIFRIKVREVNIKIRQTVAELNTRMQESLSGNHIVRLFGKVRQEFDRYAEINSNLKSLWLRNVYYYALYFPSVSGLTEISIMLIYFAGSWLFFRDQVTIGTLMAFSWYMGMFWRPLRELSERYTQVQTALAAAERVFTLFDVKARLPSGETASCSGPASLVFKAVDFSYEENKKVLSDISFQLNEGETLAVVGATGSGKSTLLSLCNGFYQPDKGEVLICGRPIQNYQPGALQNHISFIPQDVYLFSESVAFNIALSDDFDMDKLQAVCRRVNAHQFIEKMPGNYLAKVTERGENLSLGQRQLLAFARALYHSPKILLLDEATSAVDTETEELVQDALQKLTKSVTAIVVAHRLSTIKSADRILVIHKGEIRESGTHASLLLKKGIYQKLYQLQHQL